MMPKFTILAALVVTLALATGGAGQAQEIDVEKVFKFYCAQCHGVGGKGDGPNVTEDFPVSPRNFTNPQEMNKLTNADIKNVVMDGGPAMSKSPMMPPWGKTLSEAQVDALIGYLRVLCNCKGKEG